MICSNCGNKNEEKSRFCVKCGSKLIGDEVSSKEEGNVEGVINGQTSMDSVKPISGQESKKKNPKTIAAIIISIVAIIAIFMGVKDYKSKNVSKKVIKEDFIGSIVNVGAMKIEVNKDNLKSVKLGEKVISREFGIRTYENTGAIVLKDDKYEIQLPIEVTYIYYGINNDWILGTNSINSHSENVQVEIKEKATEDIIKKAFVGVEVDGVEITEEVANGLVIDSMEEDQYGTVINAYSTLENKGNFVNQQMNLTSKIIFDGKEWTFDDTKSGSSEKNIVVNEPSGELSTDEIKKDLLMLVEDKKFVGYMGFKSISVLLDDISNIKDLKVDSVNGDSYIITANVDGKSDNLMFDGNIKITVSKKGYADSAINFNKVSVDNPTEDQVKELVAGEKLNVWIDKKSNYHLITDNDKETFKINEVINDKSETFVKHVYGNMTYTEKGNTITSDLIYIKMTYDTSGKKWKISKMVSSTDTSFNRYYSKDVINK